MAIPPSPAEQKKMLTHALEACVKQFNGRRYGNEVMFALQGRSFIGIVELVWTKQGEECGITRKVAFNNGSPEREEIWVPSWFEAPTFLKRAGLIK